MSPFAYLIPYANHHAFESAMGPKAYEEALSDFFLAVPTSLGQGERDLLIENWKCAWSRYRKMNGAGSLTLPHKPWAWPDKLEA